MLNSLLGNLSIYLNSFETLALGDDFEVDVQVYSKTHTLQDSGIGVGINRLSDSDTEDSDDSDTLVGANPDPGSKKGSKHIRPLLLKIQANPSFAILENFRCRRASNFFNRARCVVLAFLISYYHTTHNEPQFSALRDIANPNWNDRRKSQVYLVNLYDETVKKYGIKPNGGPHKMEATLTKLSNAFSVQCFVMRVSYNRPVRFAYPPIFRYAPRYLTNNRLLRLL